MLSAHCCARWPRSYGLTVAPDEGMSLGRELWAGSIARTTPATPHLPEEGAVGTDGTGGPVVRLGPLCAQRRLRGGRALEVTWVSSVGAAEAPGATSRPTPRPSGLFLNPAVRRSPPPRQQPRPPAAHCASERNCPSRELPSGRPQPPSEVLSHPSRRGIYGPLNTMPS